MDLTPFLCKLRNWSFRIKTVLNDQCGSVRKVLSVRRRRPRFARPPGAFGPTSADSLRSSADRGLSRSAFKKDWTDTIKSEDLTPFLRKLRNWSFRIKTVLNDQCGSVRKMLSVRHRRPRFARPPIGVRRDRLSIRTFGRDGTDGTDDT